jgi:hypothetical protein
VVAPERCKCAMWWTARAHIVFRVNFEEASYRLFVEDCGEMFMLKTRARKLLDWVHREARSYCRSVSGIHRPCLHNSYSASRWLDYAALNSLQMGFKDPC